MEDERVNRIAALLEQGRYLAAQTDAFPVDHGDRGGIEPCTGGN